MLPGAVDGTRMFAQPSTLHIIWGCLEQGDPWPLERHLQVTSAVCYSLIAALAVRPHMHVGSMTAIMVPIELGLEMSNCSKSDPKQ